MRLYLGFSMSIYFLVLSLELNVWHTGGFFILEVTFCFECTREEACQTIHSLFNLQTSNVIGLQHGTLEISRLLVLYSTDDDVRLSLRSTSRRVEHVESTLQAICLYLLRDGYIVQQKQDSYTVGDYMTSVSELYCAKEDTTIDEALEVLVEKRITGMPVIDDSGALVGVVSDYDLLALDSISGQRQPETSLFPEAGRTWKAFKEIQKLLIKTNGKTVGDVMTPSPLVVREQTNLEDAAKVLLDTKFRRLPVVDQDGKLVGLLTRGNVVRAALVMKRAAEAQLGGKKAAEDIFKAAE